MRQLIDLFLHLDVHLHAAIQQYGTTTYLILFVILFCETGLVVTPLLPGDSLLFAAGTFAASGALDMKILLPLLCVGAILGDAVNYHIGKYLGPRVLTQDARFFRKEYLLRTQSFFERYGAKTIVIARFVPIVRTFAPFLAGVGEMSYWKFATYNVVGAVLWICVCTFAGYFFGNIPIVKQNFTLVVLAIIFISVLPALIELWRDRRHSKSFSA